MATAAAALTCATSWSDEPGMSPLEIWCNESQERYVLAVAPDQLPLFDETVPPRARPVRGNR
ncbi:Phosphoribosylformylglycinamidine synthase [Leclercia adecarboxylata]|uniref:Phosphoribosylformylglycinamidine synthase n=1 Tax=Leclercia adecarboxylata TaxID=83655 RepID=A0A4U9ID97_9ENTR|nr:Phosphoribosylformylglycinamidine synthase [Leclercia adecarboxylata]